MPPPKRYSSKSKARQDKAAAARQQGAIPCLILVAFGMILMGLFFFFAIKSGI